MIKLPNKAINAEISAIEVNMESCEVIGRLVMWLLITGKDRKHFISLLNSDCVVLRELIIILDIDI